MHQWLFVNDMHLVNAMVSLNVVFIDWLTE